MQNKISFFGMGLARFFILFSSLSLLSCVNTADSDLVAQDDLPGIVFVKSSVNSLGDPLDPIEFTPGGDLHTLVPGTPSGKLQNLTADLTNGLGDVSDPEVFPQTNQESFRLVFSMKRNSTDNWHLYEVIINKDGTRAAPPEQLTCGLSNEAEPTYLPDGRIVFTSDRPGHLDEYERRKSLVLHILDRSNAALPAQPTCGDVGEIVQISFNQSHDRNPTVLKDGTILFSRWEHLGRVNKFTLFSIEPDGTDLFVKYGSHSGVNSFLNARELADGRLISTMMPLTGTFEGGAVGLIDVVNEADNAQTASQQLTKPQIIPTGRTPSDFGRYFSAYEVPDGSKRYLVSYATGSVVRDSMMNLVEEPSYGLWMLNNNDGTLKPIKLPSTGTREVYLEPIPLMATPANLIPTMKIQKTANRSAMGLTGVLAATSVYDSEANRALSNGVLGVTIPRDVSGNIDFTLLNADPALQVVKEVRVIEAVPSDPGIGMEDIGETSFERQKILGYAPVEWDGSFRITVPADRAITLNVVDSNRRSFKVKENWLQVRPGENKTCNGCHSPRRGNPQRLAADSIALNRPASPLTSPAIPVIDYTDHVQTIFTAKCVSCHSVDPINNVNGPAGGLELVRDQAGGGFPLSYDQLLDGSNGSDLVFPGESRQSHLIERIFGEELRAGEPLPASDPAMHSTLLTDPEKLTLVEWIDLGAQFTNKQVITNTGRKNLDQTVFQTAIQPILQQRCAGCHVAGGGSNFVLTGSLEGDLNATASRTNVTNPANSILLLKATGTIPMFVDGLPVSPPPLALSDPDYTTILNWISAAN
jgi:mono/diheme cytochrome c family protein